MNDRKWLDNAFWTDGMNQQAITAILEFTNSNNQRTTQVMQVPKSLPNGNPNPDFEDIIKNVSTARLDTNTKERQDRKKREVVQRTEKEREVQKARELEQLFELKLKAFEIPEIKNSKNRVLKSRLRKSKSIVEANAYTAIIIMDTINNEQSEPETE